MGSYKEKAGRLIDVDGVVKVQNADIIDGSALLRCGARIQCRRCVKEITTLYINLMARGAFCDKTDYQEKGVRFERRPGK